MALSKITADSIAANAVANSIGYVPANKAGDTFTGDVIFSSNVGIGNTAPAHKLSINGSVYVGTPFIENPTTVTANYTIAANTNAMSAGPITVANGVTVTISNNSVWTII